VSVRHPAVDKTEERDLQLDYFDASSSVAKSRPITPPQREDAVGRGAGHHREGVLDAIRVAGVGGCIRERLSESGALVVLADGKRPGASGELSSRRLDGERCAGKVEDLSRPAGILVGSLPSCSKDLSAHPVRRAGAREAPRPTPGTREISYRWALPSSGCRR